MACSLLRYFMYEQSQILTPSIKTSLNDLMTVEELVTFAKNHRASNHPIYKKFVTKSKKIQAHDKDNKCKIGDTVEIIEAKPLSKTKKFEVVY